MAAFTPVSSATLERGAPSHQITEGVFAMVVRKWQAFPNSEDFPKSCAEGLGKLLPKLRMEYTAHQVPKILRSECDVWATKKGYTLNGSSIAWPESGKTLSDARRACEFQSELLGEEFSGKQDYLGW